MKRTLLLLVLAAPVALADDWSSLVARIEKAAPAGNAEQLRALRADLMRELAPSRPPRDEALRRYTAGYVARTLAFAKGTSAGERRDLLLDAITQLERATELDPRNADAHALLGSTYGTVIAFFHERSAELGGKARQSLRKALDLEPHNPRVQFLHGSSAFYRPAEYGGGPSVAEPFLRKALELFKNEPLQKPWPNWGRFDTYVLLGQTLEKMNRRDAAVDQYELALAIAPQSEYVRGVLIPRARRK